MWRPPERIKHAAHPGRWPSATEAQTSRLFSPVKVGPITLAERTWVPAMVPWRATDEGFVTDDVLQWYERFARGQPGVIVVEATGIRDVRSGPLLRAGHERFLPGLREIVSVVRRASGGRTRILIQLIDFLAIRRRPVPEKFFAQFLQIVPRHLDAYVAATGAAVTPGPAAVREWLAALTRDQLELVLTTRELEALDVGARERVTDTHLPHIAALPQTLPRDFARAAHLARNAGFDGIELHFAHAYTMASLLSPLNARVDGYGGTRENRARLPLEVYRAVRAAVDTDCAVGCRMLAEECIADGGTIDDAAYFAREFASAGFDFLSLSRGGKFDDALQPKVGQAAYPYTGRSGYECMPSYYSDAQGPFGRNVAAAATIRATVREAGYATPIVTAGGVHNFEQAEKLLRDNVTDIVGVARQALADPDWFRKIRTGHGEAVRLCIYTNYCEALDQRHRQVTCELWDRVDLDAPGVRRSIDRKRRLVAPDWKSAP
ncbi:MAG: NADH:flavin oxidoreductase [Pseudomonadales bacterium]|nr:NADH:flavin oxidoreductase [Pseudomonadales bacterium]